jgi:MFS family permease
LVRSGGHGAPAHYSRRAEQIGAAEEILDTRGRAAKKMSQTRLILIGAGVLLSLGMGIRQSLGLFLAPVTRDLALTAADFTLAVAVQNIVWGLSQAPVGAIADRFGLRGTMMAGAAIYVLGLAVMAAAGGAPALIVSGGLIGVAGVDFGGASGFGGAAQ